MNRTVRGLALLVLLSGCDRFRDDPERDARRQAAARAACLHAAVATNGHAALRQLQQIVGASDAGPASAVQQYTRAYSDYAELRATAAAYLDSAANHAGGRADSLRYVESATRYISNPPEPGTLEANIARAHAHDLQVMAADTAMPCNRPPS